VSKASISEDDFGNFDEVSNDRLSDKVVPEVPDDDDDADYAPPAHSIAQTWDEKPSIANQLFRAPDTIRGGNTVTVVLNLSSAGDLETLNSIQAQADDWNGPFVVINELTKHFHEGAWFALIRYTKIFYQKL
jgi:hypothetical protein